MVIMHEIEKNRNQIWKSLSDHEQIEIMNNYSKELMHMKIEDAKRIIIDHYTSKPYKVKKNKKRKKGK
jgi:hypothetical protein